MKLTHSILKAGLLLLAGMIFLNVNRAAAQEKGTVTDKRDKAVYHWVKYGKQAWMTGNLHFATPAGSWVYNNDTANLGVYGRLYDHATAMTACPKGWHLPTDADWTALITALGGEKVAGEKMNNWDTIGHGPDYKTVLPTLLGGVRHSDSTFTGIGVWGGMWSATSVDGETANNILFARGSQAVSRVSQTRNSAFSVRCVRNK